MILSLIIVILIVEYALEFVLDTLNARLWSEKLPDEVRGFYDEEKYRKAQHYDREKKKLSRIAASVSLVLMVILLLTRSFGLLNEWVVEVSTHQTLQVLLFFGVVVFATEILQLPLSMYSTFVIEERYGFNRTTVKTFILDKLKSISIGSVLGAGLIAIFVYLYSVTGEYFWMVAWIVSVLVLMGTFMFYATWILPLFNKLTPLPDGELRSAIENYCATVQFKLDNLFIMDGSKRSSKANAFFSGIGSKKRIVLFDTLIENHTTDEVVSVLAHEVGHYKKKHSLAGLVNASLYFGLMLFIFSKFISSEQLSQALGSATSSLQLNVFAFALLFSPVSTIVGLLLKYLSRKFEYQADRYAAETSSGLALQTALKKLTVHDLSNVHPHPAYVFFHYDHPPTLQRLKALAKLG